MFVTPVKYLPVIGNLHDSVILLNITDKIPELFLSTLLLFPVGISHGIISSQMV